MLKGLTEEQADRILENYQSFVLSLKLAHQLAEQIGRDIMGMRNGNNNNNKKEEKNGTA